MDQLNHQQEDWDYYSLLEGEKVYFNRLCSNLWWAGDVVVRHKHVAFAFVPRQCVGEKPVYVHFYD